MKIGKGKMKITHCDKCDEICDNQHLNIFDRVKDIRWDICRNCFELLVKDFFVAHPKGDKIIYGKPEKTK